MRIGERHRIDKICILLDEIERAPVSCSPVRDRFLSAGLIYGRMMMGRAYLAIGD
jgi:hypothetical protein